LARPPERDRDRPDSAIERFIHPHQVRDLPWVAAAGVIGFIGNELAARYRIRVGDRIGSAAVTADGRHARADGFTSLAVVAGAAGVALGWPQADPVTGLLITGAILVVLRGAVRYIYRRLMDAVDPALTDRIERETLAVPSVLGCDGIIHVNPPDGARAHARTAHHVPARAPAGSP
jgi:cation diffusion facilitator family transporter